MENLTDNAWVKRVGELRQMVDDCYDPADASAQEWVEWVTAQDGEEFDSDDVKVLSAYAQQVWESEQERNS